MSSPGIAALLAGSRGIKIYGGGGFTEDSTNEHYIPNHNQKRLWNFCRDKDKEMPRFLDPEYFRNVALDSACSSRAWIVFGIRGKPAAPNKQDKAG